MSIDIQRVITGFKSIQTELLLGWIKDSFEDAGGVTLQRVDATSLEEINAMLVPLLDSLVYDPTNLDPLSAKEYLDRKDWLSVLDKVIGSFERYQMDDILKSVNKLTRGTLGITGFCLGDTKYEPTSTTIDFRLKAIDVEVIALTLLKSDLVKRMSKENYFPITNQYQAVPEIDSFHFNRRWLMTLDAGIMVLKHQRYQLLLDETGNQLEQFQLPVSMLRRVPVKESVIQLKHKLPSWVEQLMRIAK